MKKLEDIPKKEIFNVPDGYFDTLPSKIQDRIIAREKQSFSWGSFSLKYALPAVLILAVAIFWWRTQKPVAVEEMLADIETADLVAYLHESDLSTDELIEAGDLSDEDATDIEEEVYGGPLDAISDDILEELDLN